MSKVSKKLPNKILVHMKTFNKTYIRVLDHLLGVEKHLSVFFPISLYKLRYIITPAPPNNFLNHWQLTSTNYFNIPSFSGSSTVFVPRMPFTVLKNCYYSTTVNREKQSVEYSIRIYLFLFLKHIQFSCLKLVIRLVNIAIML